MVFLLVCAFCQEILLHIFVNITAGDWIEVMRFPVLFCSFSFENLLIDLHFFFVVLKVAVIDHVVVSLGRFLNSFATHSLREKIRNTVSNYDFLPLIYELTSCSVGAGLLSGG